MPGSHKIIQFTTDYESGLSEFDYGVWQFSLASSGIQRRFTHWEISLPKKQNVFC